MLLETLQINQAGSTGCWTKVSSINLTDIRRPDRGVCSGCRRKKVTRCIPQTKSRRKASVQLFDHLGGTCAAHSLP